MIWSDCFRRGDLTTGMSSWSSDELSASDATSELSSEWSPDTFPSSDISFGLDASSGLASDEITGSTACATNVSGEMVFRDFSLLQILLVADRSNSFYLDSSFQARMPRLNILTATSVTSMVSRNRMSHSGNIVLKITPTLVPSSIGAMKCMAIL